MAKIEIARRYYTAERLAERWECSVDDVKHLIEIRELSTVPRLAAANGKRGIWIVPFDDAHSAFNAPLPDDIPEGALVIADVRLPGETDGEVWERVSTRLRGEGDYDPVITAAEVERYEAEYHGTGEPAATAAAPTIKTPTPVATPAVARCFAGLHTWDCGAWVRNLGDPAKWMQEALITRRNRPDPHLWDPVKLAMALLQHDTTISHKEITRRFETRPELKPWRDAWQDYADLYEVPTD